MIYAVKSIDNKPINKICEEWKECHALVKGHTAVYKSFTNMEEAVKFLKNAPVNSAQYGHGYAPILGKNVIYAKYLFDRCPEKENGFSIRVYETNKGERVTCKGYFLPNNKRLLYALTGVFFNDKKYGYEFQVESYVEHIANTKDSIMTYLSSGVIKGIGEKKAQLIYDTFGSGTMEVFEKHPERLLKIKGISKKGLEKIMESYAENKGAREITSFLLRFGLAPKYGMLLYKQYGASALSSIKQNPYLLCKLKGITFLDADNIAKQEKFPMDSTERFEACVYHVLKENEINGNTGMEVNVLGQTVWKLLSGAIEPSCIKDRTINMITTDKLKVKRLNEKQYIFTKEMYRLEASISENIIRIKNNAVESGKKMTISEVEKVIGITLDPTQKSAINTALTNSISVITGGPGTGKTTIIKFLDYMYCEKYPYNNAVFLAPTGRAARKITESTGRDASTIHSRLKIFDTTMSEEEEVYIENSLVVIDEFSMVDVYVAGTLFKAILQGCHVVLVGDIDQLPSVGPGAVLRDIIDSETIPVTRLDCIYRQDEDSQIYENSLKIKKGNTDIKTGKDFHIVECQNMEEIKNTMAEIYVKYVKKYGLGNVMCLCPFWKHTAGIDDMNETLQEMLNPEDKDKNQIRHKGQILREDDLVMHLANEMFVSNGDIGTIYKIYTDEEKEEREDECRVQVFINNRIISYKDEDLNKLTLAYAMSIHKGQGSEADAVVTCLTHFHKSMLYRGIPYVALSRGKKEETFVGEIEALNEAIVNEKANERITLSTYLLQMYDEKFC